MVVVVCSHCLTLQLSKIKIRQTKLNCKGQNEVLFHKNHKHVITYYSNVSTYSN